MRVCLCAFTTPHLKQILPWLPEILGEGIQCLFSPVHTAISSWQKERQQLQRLDLLCVAIEFTLNFYHTHFSFFSKGVAGKPGPRGQRGPTVCTVSALPPITFRFHLNLHYNNKHLC